MTDALDDRYQRAVTWAREAGRRTLRFFQQDSLTVERKDDDSPVTVADRDAETFLRQQIQTAFPDDAIIGEEFGEQEGKSGFCWILDPIDGTKSFVQGVPLYGTLIGVEYNQAPVIGVIEIPGLDERVYAKRGGGCYYQKADQDPRQARVSETARLAEAMFVTTEVRSFEKRGAAKAYQDLDARTRLARTWGDCYGYLLVAVGRADVMVDPLLNVWDAAAIAPILEEAGGVFTDWRGEETIHGGDGIGANRSLIREVVEITDGFPKPTAS